MGNQFVNLPALAANGAGAAVDVSSFGALKTIVVQGSWPSPLHPPTINIEMNNNAIPSGSWAPVCPSFRGTGIVTVLNAARWMRVRVSAYKGGTAPSVNLGGTDDGSFFAALVVPAGNGTGAAVNVSALPNLKTLQIGNRFAGSIILELSEDAGGTKWAEWTAMQAPGQASNIAAAHWARIKRVGVPANDPYGVPIATLGGTNPAAGTGGGGTVISDGITVLGDGSFGDPLTRTPLEEVLTAAGVINPNLETTIISSSSEGALAFTLAAGPVDGYVKQIVVNNATGLVSITASGVADPWTCSLGDCSLTLVWDATHAGWWQVGAAINFTNVGRPNVGTKVQVDGVTVLGEGTASNPLSSVTATPFSAEIVTADGVTPTVLDVTVLTSFVENVTGAETIAVFTLPDGIINGQIHNVVQQSGAAWPVRVSVTNFNEAPTIECTSVHGNISFVWSAALGQWFVLGTPRNFTIS